MAKAPHETLSRRERQIMDLLYRMGPATANEVMASLPGEPNLSTVRTQLRVLENKGHVRHEEQGLRYIYMPTISRQSVRPSALRHLLETFFDGSAEKMLSTLLGSEGAKLTDAELDRLAQLIEKARKAGRK
jgi:BlaI family penicillinase repressor